MEPSADTILKKEGLDLVLKCSSTGCPTPNITWTRQGAASYLATTIGNVLFHNFTNLNKSDSGYYRCSVDNDVSGSDTFKQIYLNVTCKYPYKVYLY